MPSVNLKEIIKNTIIQKAHPIGFDEFMSMALYYPGLGYYSSGAEKFGAHGDFITAPETSDLFGYTLARQCAEVLDGGNDILEFGAGSGVLAAQILFELGRLDKLPKTYYILELSAELKQRQKENINKVLPELMDRVVWLNKLPSDFSGVVIANEVLDAMPAKRVIYQNDKFIELGVGLKKDGFVWQTLPSLDNKIQSKLPESRDEGFITEVNLQAMAWVESLYHSIKSALVLLIDYGMDKGEYFHQQRTDGTLRCYYQHKATDDPFIHIGEQDITTSVNFSDVADQARQSGFTISGYATQALFLISLGIDQYLLAEKDEKKRARLAQQVKQLVLPSAMGESFKVLALSKNLAVEPSGFKEQDLRAKL